VTRHDQEALAAVLKEQAGGDQLHRILLAAVANGIADYIQSEHPRFDREKFLKAAGV
jgi:hypothetical protein